MKEDTTNPTQAKAQALSFAAIVLIVITLVAILA